MRQFMDRYGVALGVILGLIVLIAVLPGNATMIAWRPAAATRSRRLIRRAARTAPTLMRPTDP